MGNLPTRGSRLILHVGRNVSADLLVAVNGSLVGDERPTRAALRMREAFLPLPAELLKLCKKKKKRETAIFQFFFF